MLGKARLKNNSFTNNQAMGRGGALYLSTDVGQTTVEVNESNFDGNMAGEAGGAFVCEKRGVPGTVTTRFSDFEIRNSEVFGFGSGGAGLYDCDHLEMRDGIFESNHVKQGTGGAIAFTQVTKCASKQGSPFVNIQFKNNSALNGAGALFFDHIHPDCQFHENRSSTMPWTWKTGFAADVLLP